MGLVTLALVGCFTLLYISSAIPKKPPAIDKALAVIRENLNPLAMGGLIFGIVAFLISPLMLHTTFDIFVRMFGDFLLIVMTLPYSYEKLIAPHSAKINAMVLKELKSIIERITTNGKYIGGAGVVASILLFATIFR